MTFPFLFKFLPSFDGPAVTYFGELVRNVMSTRRQTGNKLNDFVDVVNEMLEKVETEEYKKLGITDMTVYSQAFVFFFAGKYTLIICIT